MVAKTQRRIELLPTTTIAAAVNATAGAEFLLDPDVTSLAMQATFAYGAGGTSATAYVQTSIDGANWVDISCFAFTTSALVKFSSVNTNTTVVPTTAQDGALTANTNLNGIIGGRLRLKYVTTGTYSGATSLNVSVLPKCAKSR